MLGIEESASAKLGEAGVVPVVEQAIPENRPEETMLPTEGIKLYQEKIRDC